jgi:hypothetical protein
VRNSSEAGGRNGSIAAGSVTVCLTKLLGTPFDRSASKGPGWANTIAEWGPPPQGPHVPPQRSAHQGRRRLRKSPMPAAIAVW